MILWHFYKQWSTKCWLEKTKGSDLHKLTISHECLWGHLSYFNIFHVLTPKNQGWTCSLLLLDDGKVCRLDSFPQSHQKARAYLEFFYGCFSKREFPTQVLKFCGLRLPYVSGAKSQYSPLFLFLKHPPEKLIVQKDSF